MPPSHGTVRTRTKAIFFALLALLLTARAGLAQPAEKPAATAILPLNDVRVGMKGYGMTVFHGVKIEPFPVEVISVMRDFAPRRGVVWIRCDDERLVKSGPVAGMSGSPIYLWDDKDAKEPGKGGKLIGAFAFGFSWTKDCYAGVQPIEAMRKTGDDIAEQKPGAGAGAIPGPGATTRRSALAGATLTDLLNAGKSWRMDDRDLWKAQAMAQVVGVEKGQGLRARGQEEGLGIRAKGLGAEGTDSSSSDFGLPLGPRPSALGPSSFGPSSHSVRLMLPMSLGSAAAVEALTPLLAPLGIQPFQTPAGASAGLPPPGIDAKSIKLEPGSVLAIPLAFGDMDLSASGTVTDVLPDGRVLAFGHPMFGQGDTAMPMGTGFVHFVVPRLPGSFKLGGSAEIKGTILRDDASAVAGKPGIRFHTAPVAIHVNIGGKKKTYKYHVVHHERLTPSLVMAVAMQSLSADQGLPTENTLRMKGEAVFEGNRRIELSSVQAPANEQRLLMDLVPAVATMLQNPHEPMRLTALELTIDVSEKIDQMNILGARIDKPKVEPGEEVVAHVTVQGYGKPRESRKLTLRVPESLDNGRYSLTIGDARAMGRMIIMSRPHLLTANSADDVFQAVKLLTSMRQDVIYGVLQLPASGVAVGRVELPNLPSSKRLLITSAQDTFSLPLADWRRVELPVDAAVSGEVSLEIEVEKIVK